MQHVGKNKIQLNLARLTKSGRTFEVDVDPDLALNYKAGKPVELTEVLKAQKIFNNAKKGELASEVEMKEMFNTSDALEVASIILKEGSIQMTSEHRDKIREEKRNKIVNMIHKYGVDPRTNAPHPLTRIENALVEGKVKIDESKAADQQVKDIIKMLQPILPIKFEVKQLKLHIPSQHANKAQGIVKQFSKMLKSEWATDGSFNAVVEIPGGLEEDFLNKLNNVTHGTVTSEIEKIK
jgi:ribosome maturation protein SDO1